MIIRGKFGFDTEEKAIVFGKAFIERCGYGYEPTYTVAYDDTSESWFCLTERQESCD